jgi:hypothetical protein
MFMGFAVHTMRSSVILPAIPNGIIPFTSAGCLIQEGSDNTFYIDINTETVDGKATFHYMARAVFQLQTEGSDETSVEVKIKRGQNKSLPVDEQTMSVMSYIVSCHSISQRSVLNPLVARILTMP